MNMKMKKVWCLVLAAAVLLAAFPAAFGGGAVAAGSFSAEYQNNFSQSLNVILTDANLSFVQGENFRAENGKLAVGSDTWAYFAYKTPSISSVFHDPNAFCALPQG